MSGVIAAAGISAAAGIGAAAMSAGKGGGGGGGGQGQVQQQQLPEWINNGLMQNYGAATRYSYDMPGPYEGQRVANLSPEMQNLIAQQYGNVGSTNNFYDTALAQTNALSGFQMNPLSVQRLANTDLSAYMNPYSGAVINPAIAQMEQARRQALMQVGDQATQAKAFGGSRQGVAEGVTNAQSEMQKGSLVGNLLNQNWQQAVAGATGDITRDYAMQQQNQANRLLGAQFQAQMANQYGALAGSRQQNFLSGIEAAMRGQTIGYQNQQAQLDAAKALYEEQRMDPIQRIQLRQSFLTGNPAANAGTSYGSGPATSSNPFLTGISGASATAGLLGTLGKDGLWGGGSSRPTGPTIDQEIANWSNYATPGAKTW